MTKPIILTPKDLNRLRRITLHAQGLLKANTFGSGIKGAARAIEHLAYVQLDTISVIERAHHHVLYSRVPGFKPTMANQLLRRGDIFEYWSHAAAFLPIADFRFSLPYKHALKNGQTHWNKNPDRKLMGEILARIRAEGPLRSRDLEGEQRKGEGWWEWKPAKKALEQLYMEGDLMVCDREGFQKTYDLTERVLPNYVNTKMPSVEEYAEHVLAQQLRCQGVVSLKGACYHQPKNPALRAAIKALIAERVASGDLDCLQLPDGSQWMCQNGELEQKLPRKGPRVTIVSPFDNSVIQRQRLKALFDFDYQLECYLPEPKRKFGYFSLPILYGDCFVGRMDCKAHRETKTLEIKALYLENSDADYEAFIADFSKALQKFSDFQNCTSVTLCRVLPKSLSSLLKTAITA